MKQIALNDLEVGKTYIVESPQSIRQGKNRSVSVVPKVRGMTEFEDNFDFEYYQVFKLLKIEEPFYLINGRRGEREFVKLQSDWVYFEPSEEFIKELNHRCDY